MLLRHLLYPVVALFLITSLIGPAKALASSDRADLSETQQGLVDAALDYLNHITTLRADFVQITSKGDYAEGKILVNRPGKARFDYNPPHPILLVASGFNLLYYDKELQQATFIPVHETPLWFLLRREVALDDSLHLTGVSEGLGSFSLHLEEKNNPEKGQVTITFNRAPFTLSRWEITDAQGVVVIVSLINPEYGVAIDNANFSTRNLPGISFEQRR